MLGLCVTNNHCDAPTSSDKALRDHRSWGGLGRVGGSRPTNTANFVYRARARCAFVAVREGMWGRAGVGTSRGLWGSLGREGLNLCCSFSKRERVQYCKRYTVGLVPPKYGK
jgi:hypothetical protein